MPNFSDFENLPRDSFDDFFGDGSLDDLKSKLTFNNQKSEIVEGVKSNIDSDTQIITFIWGSSYCKILYSKNTWNFVRMDSADVVGLFSFLTSVLPEFAASKGVKEFICIPDNETVNQIFQKAGFMPDDNGVLVCKLRSTSKLEQYGEWVSNNKDLELEPSWRKELNNG